MVAALAPQEFGWQRVSERQDVLARQAARLKYIAESFHIPVVVTNQATTRFERDMSLQPPPADTAGDDPTGAAAAHGNKDQRRLVLTPALGNTWAHCVNVRLLLRQY